MKSRTLKANIPEGWKYSELGELMDYEQPQPYLVSSESYNSKYPTPVLTAGKTFVLGYTDEATGIYSSDLPVIIFDDFTTAHKYVDFPFKAKSSAMKILKAKRDVNLKFVYGWMNIHPYVVGEHKRNYLSEYQYQDVLTPSLSEQNRIVSVLETWDMAIEKLKKKIKLKVNNKKAFSETLLTGKIRLQGFNDSWQKTNLNQLFDITSSKRVFESDWRREGVPFYRAREIVKLASNNLIKNELFISREMYELYRDKYGAPEIDDLLITGVGTIGKIYRVTGEKEFYFKDGNIIWLKTKKKALSSYIEQLFHTHFIKKQVVGSSPITTVATYTIDAAKKTRINLPPINEQIAIIKILENVDHEIQLLKRKLDFFEDQKKHLLNNLITGKIRTPENLLVN